MGKPMKWLVFVALVCCVVGAIGAESQKTSSNEELEQKFEALGRVEPDQMASLLGQVDSEASVEIYHIFVDDLVQMCTISRDNCNHLTLGFRFYFCKNLNIAEDPHQNLRRYCFDCEEKQFNLCRSQLSELFAEALADLSESDKKLVLDFKQQLDQGDHSIGPNDQVEAAHQKLLATYEESQIETSCDNVSQRLETVEMLAEDVDKSADKELAKWLAVKNVCSIYLSLFSPEAIESQSSKSEFEQE